MLGVKNIREQKQYYKDQLSTRGEQYGSMIDELIMIDENRRILETERQQLLTERKSTSKQIGIAKKNGQDTSEIESKVKNISSKITELNSKVEEENSKQNNLLLMIPNLPHKKCPVGKDSNSNPVIRTWGEKPTIKNPKNHIELCNNLNIVDFDKATKISGSGYAVFKNEGAKLQRALINFMLDVQTKEHGYCEHGLPILLLEKCLVGTGQLPKFREELFHATQDNLFLAPTAEVPLTNLVREELLNGKELPLKYTASTLCFRREAGAAGKINRGLLRMHQFDKVELVQIVNPEQSFKILEELTKDAETILQKLGLHYRVIELCSGDLGFSSSKTYDLEVWSSGQNEYIEVSSCSNFGDYQSRRINLRYKNDEGKNEFPHTLNGSGLALPRLFVALIETYQKEDGSIVLPEILQKYTQFDKISN